MCYTPLQAKHLLATYSRERALLRTYYVLQLKSLGLPSRLSQIDILLPEESFHDRAVV